MYPAEPQPTSETTYLLKMNIKPFTLSSSESWSHATSGSSQLIDQRTIDSLFTPHIAEDAGLQLCFDAEWPLLDHDPTNEDSGLDLAPIESICNLESIKWNAETIGIEPEAGEGKSRPITWFNVQCDMPYLLMETT